MMRILIVHNKYLCPGGEDEVVKSEQNMLERFGNTVLLYERSNHEIKSYGLMKKIRFFFKDIYVSQTVFQDIQSVLKRFKPDIIHIHNTFSVIGNSIYRAGQEAGIPVVQTLHNYRFLCPIGVFYRGGIICEDCTTKGKKSAVINRCWKNSYLLSGLLVNTINNAYEKINFSDIVGQFIVPTKFSQEKYVKNGWDPKKLSIKSNFLSTDLRALPKRGDYALFVGSLQSYKGVELLVTAFRKLGRGFPLKIIGDGPLRNIVEESVHQIDSEYLGQQKWQDTIRYIQQAKFLILPSTCYEVSPRVIIEAFACGVPVVVSNIGGMAEAVTHGKTGFHFKVNDSDDLAEKAKHMFEHSEDNRGMGHNARLEYEQKYTVEKNYSVLMSIYQQVLTSFRAR